MLEPVSFAVKESEGLLLVAAHEDAVRIGEVG
jgi:hypothetical protein